MGRVLAFDVNVSGGSVGRVLAFGVNVSGGAVGRVFAFDVNVSGSAVGRVFAFDVDVSGSAVRRVFRGVVVTAVGAVNVSGGVGRALRSGATDERAERGDGEQSRENGGQTPGIATGFRDFHNALYLR